MERDTDHPKNKRERQRPFDEKMRAELEWQS